MKYSHKLPIIISFFLVISACATPVFESPKINKKLTYSVALNNFDSMKGQYLMWGGTVLSGENLKDTTELEVLAYPLDGYGEPIKDSNSYGRFLVVKQGYLELGEYAKDRNITVMAQLKSLRKDKVGDSAYQYPIVEVEQIKLWPVEPTVIYDDYNSRFQFGIGIHHGH